MPVDADTFIIKYEGLDADSGGMDMILLAKSLDGYARILATTSNFAVTYVYQKHIDAMAVRVRVQETRAGSFEVYAALDWLHQSKMLEALEPALKAVVEWAMARLANKTGHEDLKEVALKQLEIIEKQGDHAHLEHMRTLEIMDKMVDGLTSAARNATSPIGETCKTATLSLGQAAITVYDERDRDEINSRVKPSIQPSQIYRLYISELDVETGGAKVTLGLEDEHRFNARITDPVVSEPTNPYAEALYKQEPVTVRAKAEIVDGEIVRFNISDTASDSDIS